MVHGPAQVEEVLGEGLYGARRLPGKCWPVKGGEEQLLTADFDHNCRFMVENLPDGDSVHLRAIGTGWHFEVDLPVPAHGDPPFLCLRPTCRAP